MLCSVCGVCSVLCAVCGVSVCGVNFQVIIYVVLCCVVCSFTCVHGEVVRQSGEVVRLVAADEELT